MASLLSSFTIGAGATNTVVSILSPSFPLNKVSQVPIVKNRSHGSVHSKASCNYAKGNPNSDPTSDIGDTSLVKLDRRNLITGGIPDQIPFGALQDFVNSRQHPKMKATGTSSESGDANEVEHPKTVTRSGGNLPITLDSAIRLEVVRPKKSRGEKEKEDEEEVLLIKGIEHDREKFVKFDVFINEEDDSARKPTSSWFAGTYVNVAHKKLRERKTKMKTDLRLAMNELLEEVEYEDDDIVIVTIVPPAGTDSLTIGGVQIEFVSD